MRGGVLLMPLDVLLFELGVGRLPRPRADWSEAARTDIADGIRAEMERRGRAIEVYRAVEGNAGRLHAQQQVIKLHDNVRQTIVLHEYTRGRELPTKQGRFEWSLGPQAGALREPGGPDYALFILVLDSYTSSGTAMLVGAVVRIETAIASLVDLRTGDILWFNHLSQVGGDLRDIGGAHHLAGELLSGLPR
jgi:hypothetical protein